jgi:hypothetical protein
MKARLISSLVLILAAHGQTYAQDRDPEGEEAYYKVEKGSRTSGIIKSGQVDTSVGEKNKVGGKPSYPVDLEYKLKIDIIGTQSGTETIDVPAEYFTEEFLVMLREEKSYEAPKFKIKHQGFVNTETANGEEYRKCDKLFIYDIDTSKFQGLRAALKAAAIQQAKSKGIDLPKGGSIDDLEITALVKYGVPVLGAVKIDISGKYKGTKIKAGADYDP